MLVSCEFPCAAFWHAVALPRVCVVNEVGLREWLGPNFCSGRCAHASSCCPSRCSNSLYPPLFLGQTLAWNWRA